MADAPINQTTAPTSASAAAPIARKTRKTIKQSNAASSHAAGFNPQSAPLSAHPAPASPEQSRKVEGQGANPLASFHPVVQAWFRRRFTAPTDAQAAGWPLIQSGRDVLIAAPTGSGKTLAAFLAGIDSLIKQAESADLDATTQIVYVSPLKALGNDIQRNLEAPLAEITEIALEMGYRSARGEPVEPRGQKAVLRPLDLARDRQAQDERGGAWPDIRVAVRTGDTSQKDRQAFVKTPPHILITTPESLYLMLTAARSRETLRRVRTVIVDEIHAVARDKRGSHLALSLARLDHVCARRPARIGLSATQRPVEEIAAFLVGTELESAPASHPREGFHVPKAHPERVQIIDLGHQRDIDLHVEVPPSDLEAVAPREQWADIYDRLAGLIRAHRTTLVFVNTRRLSERVAYNLRERLGEDAVASHHGSLSRDRRLQVEQRLKAGDLKALVCTASLELGIDIGSIDLVCQIGSPRSIATFLQRVGRSGHALGLRPQGRLFPTSRDELVECAALIRAVRAGRLDRIVQPVAPLDILAQQIVAECACEDWREDDLYDLVRRATPYRGLSRDDFDDVIDMLSEGVGDGPGRAAPLLHRDRINRVLRGRRGARMTAILNGGAIPEMADYRVVAEPDDAVVGTVNEDWAVESMQGDIFLLGSHSWRIKRVAAGEVRVEDAQGAPPTIPFWLGEAPGRSLELSQEVGRFRRDVVAGLDDPDGLRERLKTEAGLEDLGAVQIIDYLRATRDALGLIPSDTDVVFERFFDETGGMQLVVHAPFGARINRAWGLTLRKRFCVRFDFELQAAASDDSIALSLGPQHSFPLEEAFDYVTPRNAEDSLRQAVLYAPVFPVRWRWDAGRALAVLRYQGARKVPPPIQRMRADDLLAAVFPAQVGCQENVTGRIEAPDHPLIRQTIHDCLYEAMDLAGLVAVLERIEAGEIRLYARDTLEPSPMAHEILNGKPYTYLDDAPLEERRTRAVTLRRALPESARELGALDLDAIKRVREEAWPAPRDAEETHDALLSLVVLPAREANAWQAWLDALVAAGRAAKLSFGNVEAAFRPPANSSSPRDADAVAHPEPARPEHGRRVEGYFAAENLKLIEALYPGVSIDPELRVPEAALVLIEDPDDARRRLLRGWTEAAGPISPASLGDRLGLIEADVAYGLRQLEGAGFVLRGRFTPSASEGSHEPLRQAQDAAQSHPERPSTNSDEYCDRRLLARIHRYTLDRLRREIDPVSAQDYMRFLLRWQHLTPDTRLAGKAGVRQAIARLQGFEAAAASWERELLPARVNDYRFSWLDELCLAGEVIWARLTPRKSVNGAGTPTRATPLTIALRRDFGTLLRAVRGPVNSPSTPKSGAAAEIYELLRQRGALFFDEIVNATRRLRSDVERGLRGLVAGGLVTADGYQGLRQLVGRGGHLGRRRGSISGSGYTAAGFFAGSGPAGRWALVQSEHNGAQGQSEGSHEPLRQALAQASRLRRQDAAQVHPERLQMIEGSRSGYGRSSDEDELAEAVADVLLQRYGVLFRDLYTRESLSLPWRDILRALRRLEARGLVRGGRFVSGFSGEQYALPEAVDTLRWVRRQERAGERVWVSAVDPANLSGVIVSRPKIPALAGRGVLFVDGLPQEFETNQPIKAPVPTKLASRIALGPSRSP